MGEITCLFLGGAELLVDGAPASVDTRKAIALVAYLSIEGRTSRDTLAGVFWPESPDTRARSALRRTLSAVRSGLGEDSVVADRNTAAISSEISTDLTAFRDALDETHQHEHDSHDVCSSCLPHLERAADQYRGDFLAGFSLRNAPDFDDWSRTVAESYRLEIAEALERLTIGRAAVGDYRGAVDAAHRWIDLDSLHEPAHRNLMLLTAWAGDRSGSIDAYRRCVSILSTELGVAPLEETTELYEAILDDDLPPPPSVRRRVRPQSEPVLRADPSLINRMAEIETLDSELMWAATGGRVVVISGDAWMGKTRLLEEFTRTTVSRGHRVLTGRGYRSEQALAYGVVTQLLGQALSKQLFDLAEVPRWALVEASRLLPELSEERYVRDDGNEARLFEAITRLILSSAQGKTLVIAIDDGQWIDSASSSLLSYMGHRIVDSPAMILVATRSVGADDSAAGAEGLVDQAVTEIHLEPLNASSLTELVSDVDEASDIIARTGGVPLLVAEHLAVDDPDTVSPVVQKYIDARLRPLDGLARQIVSALAVLDGTVDIDLLRATSGRSEDEVVDSVEKLMTDHVLREIPQTTGLGFTLDAMEQTVYEGLTPVRRRLLHGRAANALMGRPSAEADTQLAAAIADHLRRAGQESAASNWYGTAGKLAAGVYAHTEAVAAFNSALAMGHDNPAAMSLGLGEAMTMQGQYEEAIAVLQSAAASGDAAQTARAEHRTGEVLRRLGRFDQASQHFSLAERDHPEPESLYSEWALLEFRRGSQDIAADRARLAVKLAAEGANPHAEARARDILGIVTDDVVELERAVELAGDDPVARMAAINSLAHAAGNAGDYSRALTLVDEAIDLADLVGDAHRKAALLNHAADLHHRAGDEEASRKALTDAVRLFAGVQPDDWEPEVWLLSRW